MDRDTDARVNQDHSIRGRNLLTLDTLSDRAILEVLDTAELFVEVNQRTIKKVPALKGRVVASLFYEESTRTRLSFETAAKRLSADVLSLAVASSSVKKGESLRDTIATIDALGIDAVVLRHQSSGAAHQVAGYVPHVRVINAGDGLHQHPTQGLLDAFTVRQVLAERAHARGSETGTELFEGLHVLIVGDIRHSRVARSDVAAFAALGAEVRVAAPGTLLPASLEGWPVEVVDDFDEGLQWADVVGVLRLQRERGTGSFVPSLAEFTRTHGLTVERARRLRPGAIVMHPGPMNRGVEIDSAVADLPVAVVERQVSNGVPIRMAVLYLSITGDPKETRS
ncbi:MAG: aspartate carbamoyltransferase catalytic subunit [Acidobacteria bacterium]|nr:aspartate carbamoyltransferase catalytic subunit [Acidobacteriota bacterium]